MNSKGAFALRKMALIFGDRNRKAMPDTWTQMLTKAGGISPSVSSEKSFPVEALRIIYSGEELFSFLAWTI